MSDEIGLGDIATLINEGHSIWTRVKRGHEIQEVMKQLEDSIKEKQEEIDDLKQQLELERYELELERRKRHASNKNKVLSRIFFIIMIIGAFILGFYASTGFKDRPADALGSGIQSGDERSSPADSERVPLEIPSENTRTFGKPYLPTISDSDKSVIPPWLQRLYIPEYRTLNDWATKYILIFIAAIFLIVAFRSLAGSSKGEAIFPFIVGIGLGIASYSI